MGWFWFLAVVVLLAILPLGAKVIYGDSGLFLWVIAGPLRLRILPKKEKSEKEEKKEKTKKKKEKSKEKPAETQPKSGEKTGGSITDFLPLVHTALELLGSFRRKLRVNHLELILTMAGGDPADLAVNYGRAWGALGGLLPLMEQCFVIKKRNLDVRCDFTAAQTTVYARLDITITLGRLLALVFVYGFKALRQYLTIMNKRKGGTLK
jgi:hypothetical protein